MFYSAVTLCNAMRKSKYTDEEIIAAAKVCGTRFTFIRQYKNMYEAARYRGLLQSIFEWLPKSNQQYTPDEIIEAAKVCKTRTEWQKEYPGQYGAAKRLGIMPMIHAAIPAVPHGEKAYTEEILAVDAKKYATRLEWEKAGEKIRQNGSVSPYMSALGYGAEFFKKYCKHMEQRHRWTDDEIIATAAKYTHKGDWKRSLDRLDSAAYQAALSRPEVFISATAHMTPKAHPYSGSYVVYAYEFSDRYAYVGHTFQPSKRRTQHMQQGPVVKHILICPEYTYKILDYGISNPIESAKAEALWQLRYKENGWVPLWTAKAGSLGAVHVVKWTKEAVFAQAKKYKTRQEWISKSQLSYRIAKREGWFDEASAHMPKRVLGIGVGIVRSAEAREKMRQAKLGHKQSSKHSADRLAATRIALAARHVLTLQRLKEDPALFTTSMPELEARHGLSRPTLTKFMRVIRAEQEAVKPAVESARYHEHLT